MKKSLLFTIGILLVLASCKKDSDVTASTISATINGVPQIFNTGAVAKVGTSNLSVSGSDGNTKGPVISITIQYYRPIVNGNYTNSNNTSSDYTAIFYSNAPTAPVNPVYYATDGTGYRLNTVTITSISNTNVQGTFSGRLLLSGLDTTSMVTVTNGKFNVNTQ